MSASRIGALAILTVASTTLAAVLLTAAAVVLRVVGGGDAASGSQWHELRLAVLPLAPAIALALGTRIAPTRPGVGPGAVVFAIAAALLTLAYFRLTPIVAGDDVSLSRVHVDATRLAMSVAPVVLGLGVALFRRHNTRVQTAAWATLGASLVALLLVVPRANAPTPSAYLSTLQPSVEIEGNRSFRLAGNEYRIEQVEPGPIYDASAVQHGIGRNRGCVLKGPSGTLPLGNLFDEGKCVLGWDPTSPAGMPNIRPAVYVDPRGDYAVLYQAEVTGPYLVHVLARPEPRSAPSLCDGCSTTALALRTRDGVRVTLDTELLGDRLSAPGGMTALALVGATVALSLLVVAWRGRRRANGPRGREAMHEGSGVRVGAAAPLPVGPVVLSGEVEGTSSAFRDGRRFESATPGSLAAIRDLAIASAANLELAAFAVAVVTAAPLIGAHAAGL